MHYQRFQYMNNHNIKYGIVTGSSTQRVKNVLLNSKKSNKFYKFFVYMTKIREILFGE